MTYVIDTATRISGAALKAAGVTSVVRYLSSIPGPKIITKPEIYDLHTNGISIILVYEDNISDMGVGLEGGFHHGQVAVYEAASLGVPSGTGIYFANDTNVLLPNTRDTINALQFVVRYYTYRCGWYGSADVGRFLLAAKTVDLLWSVDTWGGGSDTTNCNLVQRANHPHPNIGGTSVDYDDQLTDDVGQWAA